ncbi:hypothetical protein JRQ81_005512 [Phrynocephalus forsythii]|uniref:PLA2c domain-containing protein n=1 Tax=Phrynocephalus forsythii TaxID=171643 RepID=A0A9Q0XGE4_9SAUR|nr:hypothetical protein JRQ81_005512 [Phrynocephalus forsythii]
MIALQWVLGELQEQGLLDALMYLCGVSGSTWCMSYIYEHEEWTEQLPMLEETLCNKLTNAEWDPKKGLDALVEPSKDSTFSLTDFWGSVVVYAMLHELDHHPLTEERGVSVQGKVPYPIYAAVDSNKLNDDTKTHPDIWFEFTPDEAGFFHPGAFVDVRLFGSIFEHGKLKTVKDEKSISYLRGNMAATGAGREKCSDCEAVHFFSLRLRHEDELKGDWELLQCLQKICNAIISRLLELSQVILECNENCVIRQFESKAICGYSPLLEGKTTIKQAAMYCKKSQIPFPDIDASELDKSMDSPSDCYVFQGSHAPTVMHFPVFNIMNCKGNTSLVLGVLNK